MNLHLTPTQLDTLRLVAAHIDAHGYAPTLMEIGEHQGVSKVSAYERVDALVRHGALHRTPVKARGLSLTPDGQALVASLPPRKAALVEAVTRAKAAHRDRNWAGTQQALTELEQLIGA